MGVTELKDDNATLRVDHNGIDIASGNPSPSASGPLEVTLTYSSEQVSVRDSHAIEWTTSVQIVVDSDVLVTSMGAIMKVQGIPTNS